MQWASKWKVKINVSASYKPQHNSQAERSVQIMKGILNKTKDAVNLKGSLIEINHAERAENQGSAADLFLGHKSRGHLPGSRKMPSREQILINRQRVAEKVFKRRRNNNREEFQIGDYILLQDPASKSWKMKGKITESRKSPDDSEVTYVVEGIHGGTYLRNSQMLQLYKESDSENDQ